MTKVLRSRIRDSLSFSHDGCYDWINIKGVKIVTMAIGAEDEYYRVVPPGKKYYEAGIDCHSWEELEREVGKYGCG